MTVFCDNYGCMFIDECGFCDCDKLNIVGGVCEGSYHSGRNATDNEPDCIEDKSRWYELFGTPERAVKTLQRMCDMRRFGCPYCPIFLSGIDDCNDYDALLEWLRDDAE